MKALGEVERIAVSEVDIDDTKKSKPHSIQRTSRTIVRPFEPPTLGIGIGCSRVAVISLVLCETVRLSS